MLKATPGIQPSTKITIETGSQVHVVPSDIVPGHADQSIMIYCMNSAAANIKMPELSKTLVHEEGVALIQDWINTLSEGCSL